MARKQDATELARALKAPAFGNPDAGQGMSTLDPVTPTTLVLPVTEIEAYENNPRRAENLEYPRLKDSIRARRGLTTPLTVTKRPGSSSYTIAAGGNSRLKALKELAKETGDEAFSLVTCRFEPWTSEWQVLSNHLIENDVRGDMLFGDKAQALLDWRNLYEDTHPEDVPLSQRTLVDRLAKSGYRVPLSLLNRLIYAAEHLMPHLPAAFRTGLHRHAAEDLIRLRNAALNYWNDNAPGQSQDSNAVFESTFAAICAERDCHFADWDLALFQSTLTYHFARALDLDPKLVAIDIDSLYRGYEVEPVPRKARLSGRDVQDAGTPWAFERRREIEAKRREKTRARIGAANSQGSNDPASACGSDDPEQHEVSKAPVLDAATDPAVLRETVLVAACELARAHTLEEFVQPLATGIGYFIEAPEPTSVPEEAKDAPVGPAHGLALKGLPSRIWWLLCRLADQLDPAHVRTIAASHPASWIVELFTNLPASGSRADPKPMLEVLVGESVGVDDLLDLMLDPGIGDADLDAFDQLVRGVKALRAQAAAGQMKLWEDC